MQSLVYPARGPSASRARFARLEEHFQPISAGLASDPGTGDDVRLPAKAIGRGSWLALARALAWSWCEQRFAEGP